MRYLLDTVAVSASGVLRRNPSMARWLLDKPVSDLAISVFTVGEIQQGIATQSDEGIRADLTAWLGGVRTLYGEQILPFSGREAIIWGSLTGPMQLAGKPSGTVDSLIAATALAHRLSVVTRNVKHFQPFNVPIINPWDDENGA